MTCNEAQELITAFLDHELATGERALLDAHLAECIQCRRRLEAEQVLKHQTRAAAGSLQAPYHLRERILSDPRIFPRKSPGVGGWREYVRTPLFTRSAAAIALLIFLALPFFYFLNQPGSPVAAALIESSDLFFNDKVPVIKADSEAQLVEQLIQAAGGGFHPMGYDFTALNMRPVAGAVREVSGRKVLIAVYRGPQRSLLCYTFLGSEQDAPAHAAKFVDREKKMTFFAFSHGAVNAVLHREGEVICILAAEMPMEELLALTKSKARSG
jgi:mycothiol system anti-sigma-R factor